MAGDQLKNFMYQYFTCSIKTSGESNLGITTLNKFNLFHVQTFGAVSLTGNLKNGGWADSILLYNLW